MNCDIRVDPFSLWVAVGSGIRRKGAVSRVTLPPRLIHWERQKNKAFKGVPSLENFLNSIGVRSPQGAMALSAICARHHQYLLV